LNEPKKLNLLILKNGGSIWLQMLIRKTSKRLSTTQA